MSMDGENWSAFDEMRDEIEAFSEPCDDWLALESIPDDLTASLARDLSARLADIDRRWTAARTEEVRGVNSKYAGFIDKIVETKHHLSDLMRQFLRAKAPSVRRITSNGDARAIVLKKRVVPVVANLDEALAHFRDAPEIRVTLESLARREMRLKKLTEIAGFVMEEREIIG